MGAPASMFSQFLASGDFRRQREQRHKTLRQVHVSLYFDHFKGRAAMDYGRELGRAPAEHHRATLDRAPSDVEPAFVDGYDVAGIAQQKTDARIEAVRQLR